MAAIVLKPLSDVVLVELFYQSVVGRQKGEHYLEGLRRLARLIEAELQGQVYDVEHSREAGFRKRRKVAGRWVVEPA